MGDLTAQTDVDAVVTAMPSDFDFSGSMNRALIEKAGEKLDEFILENIYKPRIGDAFAVPGFALPVRHLIFVVVPPWRSGFERENRDLLRCYRHALGLAQEMGLKKIAFPALGTGRHGYPVKRAARLALQGIRERIGDDIEEVRIVCNRDEVFEAFRDRFAKENLL